MLKNVIRGFRKFINTIGEYSEVIKELLFFKKNYKSKLFSS